MSREPAALEKQASLADPSVLMRLFKGAVLEKGNVSKNKPKGNGDFYRHSFRISTAKVWTARGCILPFDNTINVPYPAHVSELEAPPEVTTI